MDIVCEAFFLGTFSKTLIVDTDSSDNGERGVFQ
jgi:hypothetical protein